MGIGNRICVATNVAQAASEYPKVLCVCAGGCLRSPTAAVVLSAPPFNFNTRAVGVDRDWALIPLDQVLCDWADEIVCMSARHAAELRAQFRVFENKRITILDIPDDYGYRDPVLIRMIEGRYRERGAFRGRIT